MERKVKIKYYADIRAYGVFANHTLYAVEYTQPAAIERAKELNPTKLIIDYRGGKLR